MALVLDNLAVHKAKSVKKKMDELLMKPVWNVPYASDLNSIEYVFSMLKRNFKKAKLNSIMNTQNSNTEELIYSAWKLIQK